MKCFKTINNLVIENIFVRKMNTTPFDSSEYTWWLKRNDGGSRTLWGFLKSAQFIIIHLCPVCWCQIFYPTCAFVDVLSSLDMFDLENDLPDELMTSGASWGMSDNMGNAKPPAQGPGPGGMQNGIESADGNNTIARQIQLSHILQQQVSNSD